MVAVDFIVGRREARLFSCFTLIYFFAHLVLDDFFFGTFAPFLRAFERPMAIACFLLVTFLPERPLLSVPFLRSCIAFFTSFPDSLLYFLAMFDSFHISQ
jgi:hypothetical protein